jgi:hypothetical protein
MKPPSRNARVRFSGANRALATCAALLCLALVVAFLAHGDPQESSQTAETRRPEAVSPEPPAHPGSRRVEHEASLQPGFPAGIRLWGEMNGLKAIDALGERLPEVAAFYGWTPEKLEEHLRADSELHVNRSGQLFYACGLNCGHGGYPQPADPAMNIADIAPTDPAPYDTSQAFLLHSRPGANRVIYLDFNGHVDNTTGNWKDGASAPPYNISGSDPATFSEEEKNRIIEIWQRVAEDFSIYQIDVTTEEPPIEALRKTSTNDAAYGIRVRLKSGCSLLGVYRRHGNRREKHRRGHQPRGGALAWFAS